MTTLAQVRSELKTLYDESWQIIARNDGKIDDNLSNEDRARLGELKGTMLEKETVLDRLRADEGELERLTKGRDEYGRPVEQHHQPGDTKRSPFARSIGDGVIRSAEYDQARKSGQFNLSRPQLAVQIPGDVDLVEAVKRADGRAIKTLLTSNDASGGSFVVNDRLAGYTPLARGELAFVDALPTQTTTSDVVEWIQQDTRTDNTAPVAEATATTGTSGLKPESGVAFSLVSKPVETIATWIPSTTRILADAPMLRSAVDDELLYMLRAELEEQCMIGTGTSPQLLGLNVHTGVQAMAAGTNAADAIFNASMAVRFTGGVPATAAIVGPATLGALRLMRENSATGTLGGYLFGAPNQQSPMTVFGLDVLTAQATPATVAFVLNLTATTIALISRQGGTIETGWINDQFVRNMVTIRGELRAVLAIRRPKGIVKLTGMP